MDAVSCLKHSRIEQLLREKRTKDTLSKILEEDDFLYELTRRNRALIGFLSTGSVISQLVDIVVSQVPYGNPVDIKNTKLASEVLLSDNRVIQESIFEDLLSLDDDCLSSDDEDYAEHDEDRNVRRLWEFVVEKGYGNQHKLSYAAQIICKLLRTKKIKTLKFMLKQKDVVNNILANVENDQVVNILLELSSIEHYSVDIPTWLDSQNLVESLVEMLHPKNQEEVHEQGAQVLVDILDVISTRRTTEGHIGTSLKSYKIIEKLVSYMLDLHEENSSSSFKNGVNFLIKLIHVSCNSKLSNNDSLGSDLCPLALSITKRLDSILEILNYPRPDDVSVRTTHGQHIPLGFERLRACEILSAVFECSTLPGLEEQIPSTALLNLLNEEGLLKDRQWLGSFGKLIRDAYIQKGVLACCVDLFFRYPWNNILHTVVYNMIDGILTLPLDSNVNMKVFEHFFITINFPQRVLAAYNSNKEAGPVRLGYMGHLIAMVKTIIELVDSNNEQLGPLIKEYIDNREWNAFVATEVGITLEANNTVSTEYIDSRNPSINNLVAFLYENSLETTEISTVHYPASFSPSNSVTDFSTLLESVEVHAE
ncbi:Serine/threonine-protein phosphatase 6 regulatory subunit 3 [Zancudomyces culisetae]|uniref:Serine/threonine-protein phosphatase 6 regulatory subunit 3 n=1 Tax=Zancudomyces culisetae TaxID=1213189 RepID=A0A1R1PQR0_ZANCU|nr:Serine/threonine-protein phosphatase 6 regulatory subunit 3 [Zancudomyces culisetae]|eukprot:OMH83298.1 Serine/threonine-protein phosphatase 6 regulatory subunit 3 [Zancudomyces culisetae]